MSQAIQEPPAGQFPPSDVYERQQQSRSPAAKGDVDYSPLQASLESFTVPRYLDDFQDRTPALNEAVAKVLSEMNWVEKRGHNKFFNYDYATADDLREHVARLLGKHGLSYEQHEVSIVPLGGMIAVTYLFRVCHASGEKGPFERRTALARAISEKGSADDKSISKANVLALKDWAKGRFSIPTGDDSDDPDADDATAVDRQLQNRANNRNNGQAATQAKANGTAGGTDAMRRLADEIKASKQREAADKDKDPATKAREWVNKILMQLSADPEKVADIVAPQTVQDNVTRLKASHKDQHDRLVQAFNDPVVFKHIGKLSSVFPDLHKDITDAHTNRQDA